MVGVSVIICCYNSGKRIQPTLRHLAAQQLPSAFSWEVIIVDNNSTDDIAAVSTAEWAAVNCSVPLILVEEPIPGLSHARNKGIAIAKYNFLLFCDDDNWLDPHYLATGFDLMKNNQRIGVLGGLGKPLCESEPPTWFPDFERYYATGAQAATSGPVSRNRSYVYGAASFYRKSAIVDLNARGFATTLEDRKGNSLTAGGDVELCRALSLIGYEIWYHEALVFHHFIPNERLTWEYIERMHAGYLDALPAITAYTYASSRERSFWTQWTKEIAVRTYLIAKHRLKRPGAAPEIVRFKLRHRSRALLQLIQGVTSIRGYYNRIRESFG